MQACGGSIAEGADAGHGGILHSGELLKLRVSGGYDRVDFAIEGSYSTESLLRLELMKAEAMKAHGPVELGMCGWYISPGGWSPKGDNAPNYAFVLQAEGISVRLARRNFVGGGFPNLLVDMRAAPLTCWGFEPCRKRVEDLMDEIDYMPAREILSQIDLAMDICDLDVRLIQDEVDQDNYISRARKIDKGACIRSHNEQGKRTGVSIGKNTMMRIYDKIQEIRVQSPHKQNLMIEHRWFGSIPDRATRIEIQIRREFLKENGVDSMADFVAVQSKIVDYFLTQWFRLTCGDVDKKNKHQARAKSHPLWLTLSAAMREVYQNVQVQYDQATAAPVRDSKIDQVVGLLEAMAAERGLEGYGARDRLHGMVLDVLDNHYDRESVRLDKRFRSKVNKLLANEPRRRRFA